MPVYSLTNLPPATGLFIKPPVGNISLATASGEYWKTLYVVSASQFQVLSGSLGGIDSSSIFPTGTILKGHFTAIKLASGSILAHYNDTW